MPLSQQQLQQLLAQGMTPDRLQGMMGIPGGAAQPNSTAWVPAPTPKQPAETVPNAMAGNSANANNTTDIPPPEPNPQQDYLKAMLAQQAINPEERKGIEEQMGLQKQGISNFLDYQKGINGQPTQTDLSPLLALTDSWTGSKLQSGYKRPESSEERINAMAKLQGMGQDEREKLIGNMIKLAQGKGAQGQLSAIGRAQRLEQSQRAAAGRLVPSVTNDNVVKAADTQLSSMQKGLDLIQRIRAGKVPWSVTTKRELESDFAYSLNGRAQQGLGQAERQTFEPYNAAGTEVLSKLRGVQLNFEDPKSKDGYLSQLEDQFGGLHSSIKDIRDSRANGLLQNYEAAHAGNKYAQDTIKSLRKGYAPAQAAANPNQEAVDWLKNNPNDPRAGAIRKKLGL